MLKRIGLGAAQLGMPYGVANVTGQPDEDEGVRILTEAACAGITLVDTARAYGDSEAVFGRYAASAPAGSLPRVVSKLARGMDRGLSEDRFISELRASVQLTGVSRLYAWLVHDAREVLAERQSFSTAARHAKEMGLVEKVGVSVYGPEDLELLGDPRDVDLVQLPLNILDQRLLAGGHLDRLKAQGVEIHARSLFLQGAILMKPDALPASLARLSPAIETLRSVAAARDLTPYELALAFADGVAQVDCWIIGAESVAQVQELVRCARLAPERARRTLDVDFAGLALGNDPVVDPRTWSSA